LVKALASAPVDPVVAADDEAAGAGGAAAGAGGDLLEDVVPVVLEEAEGKDGIELSRPENGFAGLAVPDPDPPVKLLIEGSDGNEGKLGKLGLDFPFEPELPPHPGPDAMVDTSFSPRTTWLT
jgi:hypothetical protein